LETGFSAVNYWLFKTEPATYSIDDLAAEPAGFSVWEGVRNYQARNLLRDQVAHGDVVLIYHSSCKQVGVVGVAEVVRDAYPDPSQFVSTSPYFDARSSTDKPRWVAVDITFQYRFPRLLSLGELKTMEALRDMVLLKQGRLSIQPVKNKEFNAILERIGSGA
jgi:predicted RNA-binding protein with PUA-like domain